MAIINDPNIQGAYFDYESSMKTAGEYQSAAAVLPAKLKDAINEKLDYNRDLIEQKNKYAEQYFNAPSEARAKYADPSSENYVFNPFQAENLVSQYRNQAWTPYQTASDVLGMRLGSTQDIISSATGSFQSQVGSAQNQAQLARQKYEDLMGQARWEYEQTHKGGGGGSASSIEDIMALYDKFFSGEETPVAGGGSPTEEQPRYSPGSVGALSAGGQWVYTKAGVTGWEPSGFVADETGTSGEGDYSSIRDIPWN